MYLLYAEQPVLKTKRPAGVVACQSKTSRTSWFRFKIYTFELQIKLTKLKDEQTSLTFLTKQSRPCDNSKVKKNKTGEEYKYNRNVSIFSHTGMVAINKKSEENVVLRAGGKKIPACGQMSSCGHASG